MVQALQSLWGQGYERRIEMKEILQGKTASLTSRFSHFWLGEILYDVESITCQAQILPLGYILEANVSDGTDLTMVFRTTIPSGVLSILDEFSVEFVLSGRTKHFSDAVHDLSATLQGTGDGTIIKAMVSGLDSYAGCIRNPQHLPESLRSIAGLHRIMTVEEFRMRKPRILELLEHSLFMQSGIISDSARPFLAAIP